MRLTPVILGKRLIRCSEAITLTGASCVYISEISHIQC